MNKYSSYRSEMVRTDGRTDRRTDTEGYNIIPRHTLVAGYKKIFRQKHTMFFENYNLTPLDTYNGLSKVYCIKQEGILH